MVIPVRLDEISRSEALRYMGWKGECNDKIVLTQIEEAERTALISLRPAVIADRFSLDDHKRLSGTIFAPLGRAVCRLLDGCDGAVLFAATLGVQSEWLLLIEQAKSTVQALVLDAVLSAAIEQVCDQAFEFIGDLLAQEGRYPTRRFSPGYADMPISQTQEICSVLEAEKRIGLTVSSSGVMIPRKSVTAIIGVSKEKNDTYTKGCADCSKRADCTARRR